MRFGSSRGVFLDFWHFTGVWEDKIPAGAIVVLAKWDKGI